MSLLDAAAAEQADAWERHLAGVHDRCRPRNGRKGGDTPRTCDRAGYVERLHSHDYTGPLVCGCDDFATED